MWMGRASSRLRAGTCQDLQQTEAPETTADFKRWNLSLSVLSSLRPGAAAADSGLGDLIRRGSKLSAWGSRCRFLDFGFGVQDFGLRILGLGFSGRCEPLK